MSNKSNPVRNDATVARNIKAFRVAAGMSQTDLARASGVTFQQIQKYENNVNACPPGRLRQIAKATGVSMAAMFGDLRDGGNPFDEITPWSFRILQAISNIKSRRIKEAIGELIEELAASPEPT